MLLAAATAVNELRWIDYLVMAVYFGFVLGIGFVLRRSVKNSADFLSSGQSIPAWVAGLAFLSANLGAQEVIGMAASGAKYGIVTAHFYWLGAIPAMVFVALFMMPFYYGSRARSVPEYLSLRFDEKTRGVNAATFALMTIMSSGISMYAMAKLIQTLHLFDGTVKALGLPATWIFHLSIVVSALIVLGYIFLGGLTSAIYNEVLQFFLIVAGFFPLVFLALRNVGGWSGLMQKLPTAYVHTWRGMDSPAHNPLGVEWFSLVAGLGFVLSFGYWCTDFLVIQRAMAADSLGSARRTPLIAAVPKMLFPFLVILPGIVAFALATPRPPQPGDHLTGGGRGGAAIGADAGGVPAGDPGKPLVPGLIPAKTVAGSDEVVRDGAGQPVLDYDLVIPNMLLHYFPAGLLGLGLTALLASFMSGMAGNVTAFNTVWTYDIYQAYLKPNASDQHYLWVGRMTTVVGIALSIGAAYLATAYNNIMDVLQLVFAFVNAPLFATFLLGMFWRRATGDGAFYGLISGTLAATLHHGLTLPGEATPGIKGGWLATLHHYPSEMAQNFWTAIFSWSTCLLVTIVVSLLTQARSRPDPELKGLVYSLTPHDPEKTGRWYLRPVPLGVGVLGLTFLLNLLFF